MTSGVECIADRSTSLGPRSLYLEAFADSPARPTLPATRTSSAGKPTLPDFLSASSKMASGVDSSNNGFSMRMPAYPDSDSDDEMPPDIIATLYNGPQAAPPPPAAASATADVEKSLLSCELDSKNVTKNADTQGLEHESIMSSNFSEDQKEAKDFLGSAEEALCSTTDIAIKNDHIKADEAVTDINSTSENDHIEADTDINSTSENIISDIPVDDAIHPNVVDIKTSSDGEDGTTQISAEISEVVAKPSTAAEVESTPKTDIDSDSGQDAENLLFNNEAEFSTVAEVESIPKTDIDGDSGQDAENLLSNNEAEFSTSKITLETDSSHLLLLPNSISCPVFLEAEDSPVPTPESAHSKGQVQEFSFKFGNRDSDLEGSADSDMPDLVEDEDEVLGMQMYGMSPSSSVESLSPEITDVVPDLGTSNMSPMQSPERMAEQEEAKVEKEDWVGIQRTTFTNWINDCLKAGKVERTVQDLFTDLRDGILLIKLLESLTKKKVKNFSGKNPKTEHHKLENLNLAFKFMREESIKMIAVGPSNIYEGNTTLTFGMIWMLIQKYQIRVVGYNISTRDAIIQWLEALLPNWKFTNLTSEWRDGRALIAVINEVKHGVAPNVATLDPTKHRKNCTQALKAAYNHLRVPKIFTVDDLCDGKVDEKSMMTYLSYFVPHYKAKLLRWVRKIIPQFGITGFTSDWYNGQAFAAIIEVCFPGSVRYWPTNDSEQFIETILRFARRNLGSEPPFTASNLASGRVEEMQVMSMVMMIKNGELNTLAEEVRVSGPGLKEAQLNKETSFIISTAGAGPGELSIDAYYEKDGESLKFSAKEKNKTEIHLKYTPKRLMNIVFAITWSDMPVPFSPFVVAVFDSTLVLVEEFDSHKRIVGVDEPIELIVDTTRAGSGRLKAQLTYSKKDKMEAMITPVSKGRYRLEYTPMRPGSATLHLWWNKTHLDHYQILYTIISREDYAVDSCPNDKVFCTFEEVKFVVSSSQGLPLTVLQMTAIIDYEFQVPIRLSHVDGKKGHASFKPSSPGIYNIEVVCLDHFIKGSPFQVRVVDPLSLKIKEELPSCLKLGVPLSLEIDAKDVTANTMEFASPDSSALSKFRSTFQQNGANFVKAEIMPLHEGDFLVGFKYHGHWISGCPFRMQICDPSKFRLVNDLRVANAGKPVNFTVQAREVDEGDMNLVITAKGPNAIYSPRVTPSEDGLTRSVTFIPWEIGEHTISVCYGTFHVRESPITMPVIALDPTTCSATGPGLQQAYTKVAGQFNVLGKGAGWVENGTLFIRIASVVTKEECRVRIRDNNDGTYGVAYMVENPGAYLLEIKTAGDHIPGSPFRVNALPGPDPSKVKLYGPSLEENAVLTFGKPITFTVNSKEAGNGKLSVTAVGPENAKARVFIAKNDKDGEYDIDIDVLRHGKHRVNVKWSGKHIPQSPFILKVFPGADASKCIAKGPGLEDGTMGKKTSFTIDTKYAGAGLLKVRLHGRKGAFKIQIEPVDDNKRVLLANYDPKFPGEYLIKIMWCDVHIPGSPFRVKISGNEATPALPEIFTPTPRLPELDSTINLVGDNKDDDNSNGLDNPLQGQKPVPIARKSVKIVNHKVVRDDRRSSNSSRSATNLLRSSTRRRRKEFDGQLTVKMKSKPKPKHVKK